MPEQNQNPPNPSSGTPLTPELIQKVADKVWVLIKEDLKLANERNRFMPKSKTRFKGTR